MKKRIAALITAALLLVCMMPLSSLADGTRYPTPDGYNDNDYQKLVTFLELVDENGVKNGEKLSESYDPQDPTTWKGTTWENGRIKKIYFYNKKCVGKLDVSDCTMLEYLDCGGNQLTELDVSNNTTLYWLDCGSNQLTELDVSKNTALTHLFCDSNQLTELDVSKNTALKEFRCYSNQLTELDVSNNTALTYLDCDSNQLTELDVSKNTALTYLDCDSNQLTELDVSNNTALTVLHCDSNQLTELDVSKNTALTYLDCDSNQLTELDVSNNTALEWLDCDSNQLTSLDVSNNVALEWLECSGNKFATIDLSKNTALTVFSCESCELTSIDFSNNTALKEIWLRNNQLAELDVSKNTGISALNCSGNKIAHMDLRDNYKLPVDEIRVTNDGGYIGVDLHVWNWQPTNWQPTKGYYLGVWAEAKSGYNFVGWYDENDVCISTEARLPIFDIDNKVFIAKFEEGSTEPTPTPEQPTPTPEQPTPTPEQPVEGVTVDFNHNGGTVEYTYDAETYLLTLYFTPKAGYYAKSIYVNGSVVADNPSSPYVLDLRPYMKKAEIKAEIYVEFALIPGMRRVTVSSSSCGTVDVNLPDGSYTVDTDGSYLVDAGTELTLTMKPDANHYVWYVAVNGSVTAVRPGNVIKFTVETDMDITVVFRTDAAETTPTPTSPTNPPKTGAISATAMAVTAVLGGAAMLIKRKK